MKSEKGPARDGSYVDELLATQTSASNNDISGYTLCANEGQAFALPSTCDVAYGAKGSFFFRSAQSGTITFSNATFGDPAQGAPKKGYYRLSGGQRFYAHANHLYSVAALTNGAGTVVERYRYDTFGNRTILAPDGVTSRTTSSYNQQVGFTGRYEDKETKLWHFRARYYSGSLGRFIGRDPDRYRATFKLGKSSDFHEAYKTMPGLLIWDTIDVGYAENAQPKPSSMDGYRDGMSLYASYFVPSMTDPKGTWPCTPLDDGRCWANCVVKYPNKGLTSSVCDVVWFTCGIWASCDCHCVGKLTFSVVVATQRECTYQFGLSTKLFLIPMARECPDPLTLACKVL